MVPTSPAALSHDTAERKLFAIQTLLNSMKYPRFWDLHFQPLDFGTCFFSMQSQPQPDMEPGFFVVEGGGGLMFCLNLI